MGTNTTRLTAEMPDGLAARIEAEWTAMEIPGDAPDYWTVKAEHHQNLAVLYGEIPDQVTGPAAPVVSWAAFAAQVYHHSEASYCRARAAGDSSAQPGREETR